MRRTPTLTALAEDLRREFPDPTVMIPYTTLIDTIFHARYGDADFEAVQHLIEPEAQFLDSVLDFR